MHTRVQVPRPERLRHAERCALDERALDLVDDAVDPATGRTELLVLAEHVPEVHNARELDGKVDVNRRIRARRIRVRRVVFY